MPPRKFSSPEKLRLGSIYLTEKGYDGLQRLIDHYGHGPSGTIDTLIREKLRDLDSDEDSSAGKV